MSDVTIRRAEQADLEVLGANQPDPASGLVQRRFEEMTAGTGVLAVAVVDGAVVGHGFLDFDDAELVPEVKNLWVYPDQRRSGVGQAIWTWLEGQARAAGHEEVFLAVDPNNHKAIPLFLRLGYLPTGNHLVAAAPDEQQVGNRVAASEHHAVYQKSLRAY